MSCYNNNCYLPQPPRAWSRVQNSCSLITNTDNTSLVTDPYTGQLVSAIVLAQRIAMLNKGNVLQYKANSSNLTKAQRYSKIAKGQWVNRNTTWATQSVNGYTNPNNTSLKRTGNVVNIAIDPITGTIVGPTTDPPTCTTQIIPINDGLPPNSSGDITEPEIPPPIEPTPGSDTFPSIIPDTPVESIVIQDGGSLICSVYENICTGETKSTLSQQLCHPTTDSNVPGPIQDLCWNDGTQTWYPRQRYIMTNSTNKWPINAELISAIKQFPPYITSVSNYFNTVTLNWTQGESCVSFYRFDIYQLGEFVKSVDGNIFTADLPVNNCSYYTYFIIGRTAPTVVTEPSNVVEINVVYPESCTITSYAIDDDNVITLYIDTEPKCIENAPTSESCKLEECNEYSLQVSFEHNNMSVVSEPIHVTFVFPNDPLNLSTTTTIFNLTNGTYAVTLNWDQPENAVRCTTSTLKYKVYLDGDFKGTIESSPFTYTYTDLPTGTYLVGVESYSTVGITTRTSNLVTTSVTIQ